MAPRHPSSATPFAARREFASQPVGDHGPANSMRLGTNGVTGLIPGRNLAAEVPARTQARDTTREMEGAMRERYRQLTEAFAAADVRLRRAESAVWQNPAGEDVAAELQRAAEHWWAVMEALGGIGPALAIEAEAA